MEHDLPPKPSLVGSRISLQRLARVGDPRQLGNRTSRKPGVAQTAQPARLVQSTKTIRSAATMRPQRKTMCVSLAPTRLDVLNRGLITLAVGRGTNTNVLPASPILAFELCGEGFAALCAAIPVHWISTLLNGPSLAVVKPNLSARPSCLAKYRNCYISPPFLETHRPDFQSLCRDCRNRGKPSEIRRHYS